MATVQTIHGTSAHEPAQGIPQRDDTASSAVASGT